MTLSRLASPWGATFRRSISIGLVLPEGRAVVAADALVVRVRSGLAGGGASRPAGGLDGYRAGAMPSVFRTAAKGLAL